MSTWKKEKEGQEGGETSFNDILREGEWYMKKKEKEGLALVYYK